MKTKRLNLSVLAVIGVVCILMGILMMNGGMVRGAVRADEEKLIMDSRASIKMMSDEADSGIRFTISMDKALYDEMTSTEGTGFDAAYEVGSYIVPSDIITDGKSIYEYAAEENNLVKVTEIPREKWIAGEEGYMTSYVYLYDMPAAAYNKDISAAAFVKNNGEIIYQTKEVKRSIASVAYIAKKDDSAGWTSEQMSILETYSADYKENNISGSEITVDLANGGELNLTDYSIDVTKITAVYLDKVYTENYTLTATGIKFNADTALGEHTLSVLTADTVYNLNITVNAGNPEPVYLTAEQAFDIRRESAYTGQIYYYDIAVITGAAGSGWQNVFFVKDPDNYKDKGYDYLLFDYYFIQDSGDANKDTIYFQPSDGDLVLTVGSPSPDSGRLEILDLGRNVTSLKVNEWGTMAVSAKTVNGNLQGFAYGGFSLYLKNARFMSASSYAEYKEGAFDYVAPDTENVPSDRADERYDMTIENVGTFEGKTDVVKFGAVSETLWRNDAVIFINDYKSNYKWVLVDFYFSASVPLGFNVAASINDYQNLEQGASLNAFYVVEKTGDTYYKSTAATGKWITMAFKLSEMNQYIDFYSANGNEIYVADIRAVSSAVLDEVQIKSELKVPTSDSILFGNNSQIVKTDGQSFGGRENVVLCAVPDTIAWYENVMIFTYAEFKASGYDKLSIDVYIDSLNEGSKLYFYYTADGEATTIDINGSSTISGISVRDENGDETVLSNGKWLTLTFDLTGSIYQNIQIFSNEPVYNIYFDNVVYENVG